MAKRSYRIDMRFTPQEIAEMDRYRGRLSRTAWVSHGHRLAVIQAVEQRANDELLTLLEPDRG